MEQKVSIVLPVYNAQEYLHRCIDSIIEQNYTNIELIVIDDGSNDGSWNILKEYQDKFPEKVRAIKQVNMGVSKTRNKGIQLATGKYLMIIDNDDYYDQDYIKTFVSEMESNNLDVVIGGYKRPDKNGKIVEMVMLENYEYSKYKIVAAWAKIYRLDYIKDNQIEFLDSNIGEDINFTIQAVSLTNKIKIIDYVGYNWYYNDESISNTAHKSLSNGLQFNYLLNSIYDKLTEKNIEMDELIEYYFIKLNVWYMLYATRKTPYKLVKSTFNENMNWLRKRFPKYNKNKYLGIKKIKGETIDKQVIVWAFVRMVDIKIIKVFLKIYCKI
ncbi:glycosyltransferase family 2 protein [Thomasclavelia sp.]